MRTALADKLEKLGLPWAPSTEAASKRATQAAVPASAACRVTGNGKARNAAAWVAAAALAITLWGGYTRGWQWTGFRGNNQLWDWLTLLLLPVALGTIPLWIQDKDYIGKGRRVIYAAVITAWTGLVIAGYLIPLNWTGFRGQTLWDWLNLLVLPAAVTITMALADVRARRPQARLRPYQKAIVAALSAGWIVTVIGGYALRWQWTGYAGNTVWGWLGILLPLVFPTLLLPTLLNWVSGNAAGGPARHTRRPRPARPPLPPEPRHEDTFGEDAAKTPGRTTPARCQHQNTATILPIRPLPGDHGTLPITRIFHHVGITPSRTRPAPRASETLPCARNRPQQ